MPAHTKVEQAKNRGKAGLPGEPDYVMCGVEAHIYHPATPILPDPGVIWNQERIERLT